MGSKPSKRKKSKTEGLYITPVSSTIEDELDGDENPYENIDEIRRYRDVRDSVISESSGVSSLPSERFSTESRAAHTSKQRSSETFYNRNLSYNNIHKIPEYSKKKDFLRKKGVRLKDKHQKKRYASSPYLTNDYTYYTYDFSEPFNRTSPDPLEIVPFMVEAFQPLIEGSVRVMEIVPYIAFIDNIEQYRLIARRSPQEAMCQLITEIRESNEPGKWRAFLTALETAGYRYIVNLLKGETEADHTLQKKLLRLFTPAIMKDMNPKEFVDHFLEKDVITEADKEEIRCEERNYGDIAASLMLLERVPKRVENWYEIFLEVLQTCGLGHLVECLKPDDTDFLSAHEDHQANASEPKSSLPALEFHKDESSGFMPVKDDKPRNNDNHGHRYKNETHGNKKETYDKKKENHDNKTETHDNNAETHGNKTDTHCDKNEAHGKKTEIEALIAEKESLLRDIKEEKEKRQLRKEINALKKELEDIKNNTDSDPHFEAGKREPEKVTRGTNTEPHDLDENGNQPAAHSENQGDQTEKLMTYIDSVKNDITQQFKTDIETLKKLIPRPHGGNPYLQMRTPLHTPTPHKIRLKSASDSGIGYFSMEEYV